MDLPIASQSFASLASINWQQAIAATPVGIVIVDAHQPDYPTIFVNAAFERMTGYTAAEAIGRNCRFLQGHDRKQPALNEIKQALRNCTSCTVILRNYRKDGTLFCNELTISPIFDAEGQVIQFIGIQNDITERIYLETERQRLEQKHQEATQLLQTVINNTPQLIFWKDLNSVYLGCNKSFAIVAGLHDPSEIVGKTDYDLPWALEQIELFRACDAEVLSSGMPQLHLIEAHPQIDGESFWTDTSKIPLRNDAGEVIGILGTYEDITERKQAEEQLRYKTESLERALHDLQRAQTQLIQSEKMSSLGQLVAGVAHEINNPVSFIYSNLKPAQEYIHDLLHLIELYQQCYPQPPSVIQAEIEAIDLDFLTTDLPKLLTSMENGAERIRGIVLSLRTFSRLDEAEFKQVDLHFGIESTLMILQHRLRADNRRPAINVVKQYGVLPLVECYAGQLNQVFMNLFTNAIDAIEEAFQQDSTNPITLTVTTEAIEAHSVRIRVADTGAGMSQETSKRIFDPFFTTKPVGVGTGMGLAISYQVITERHQGSLFCNSQLGRGTEFVIEIPCTQLN
ncbi:PAS domain-containing protein [Cyanobacteria bacterium FACHB-DQ100]|uniref:PAS domain-containing sensor histidine kinase n=1 Tax=Leptolyngbya sp. DQ-M1 TaxID=2933920 RepID=UPI0019849C17|nr:PAS domain-containing protein [Cyanobacteria bacterium FACHB-DQ100]